MDLKRRGFLAGILAVGAAPAIVKASSLMNICVPPEPKILVGNLSTLVNGVNLHEYQRVVVDLPSIFEVEKGIGKGRLIMICRSGRVLDETVVHYGSSIFDQTAFQDQARGRSHRKGSKRTEASVGLIGVFGTHSKRVV